MFKCIHSVLIVQSLTWLTAVVFLLDNCWIIIALFAHLLYLHSRLAMCAIAVCCPHFSFIINSVILFSLLSVWAHLSYMHVKLCLYGMCTLSCVLQIYCTVYFSSLKWMCRFLQHSICTYIICEHPVGCHRVLKSQLYTLSQLYDLADQPQGFLKGSKQAASFNQAFYEL